MPAPEITRADKEDTMKYRYYSRLRPVGPGTFPNHDVLEIHNYDSRTYIEDAGCEVWGYIDYAQDITEREARSYELVKGQKAPS